MKKKGLIIATIVMVLVLAVSLTTATYAWFTAQASATIDQINLSAVAGEGLLIGAKGAASPSDYSGYRTGEVVWDSTNGIWTGSETGLGQNISMYVTGTTDPVKMSIGAQKAVSYTTSTITAESPATDIAANNWYKANGNGASRDNSTVELAAKQADYIDLELGVTAAKDDSVKQAWLTFAVTLPTGQTKLGMAAAIHFIIYVNDTVVVSSGETGDGTSKYVGLSAYPGKSYTNNYSGSVSSGTYVSAAAGAKTADDNHTISQYGWFYVVPLYDSATAMESMTDIETVRVIAWIEGTDDACVIPNAGTGGNIDLYFDYAEAQTYQWASGVMSAKP